MFLIKLMRMSFDKIFDLLPPLSKYDVGCNSLKLDFVSQLSERSDDVSAREEEEKVVRA